MLLINDILTSDKRLERIISDWQNREQTGDTTERPRGARRDTVSPESASLQRRAAKELRTIDTSKQHYPAESRQPNRWRQT